ncbi:MAG: methionyl-tRNA formyltransferase [Lachnospiraceae bacterium]|nr:methionyl-tRNA formyltransferase [Lachnospiraceae bacterium]
MKIIIATIKSWNIERAMRLKEQYEGIHEILVMTQKEELNLEAVKAFAPDYILLPHWSYFISEEITQNWNCVVFHMTDLPYGRGGSPLQNLIVRGHKETKISAIAVTKKLDGGPVYMKHPLSLEGSAQEIFIRCSDIIFTEMIPKFLTGNPQAVEQTGEPVIFKRRTREDGELKPDMSLEQIYDYIRMLDAEGYPRAFMDFGKYELSFEQAHVSEDGTSVEARVVFKEKM